MTLEEIENRSNKFSGPDRYMMTVILPKLIAVAKAAQYDREAGNFIRADKTCQALDDIDDLGGRHLKLEEMSEITARATPGPWAVVSEGAGVHSLNKAIFGVGFLGDDSVYTDRCDAEFIAMARNKMDKLLAVVRAAKQVRAQFITLEGCSLYALKLALEELEKDE